MFNHPLPLQPGRPLLCYAVSNKSEQFVETLIKAGADVNVVDKVSYIRHKCVIITPIVLKVST